MVESSTTIRFYSYNIKIHGGFYNASDFLFELTIEKHFGNIVAVFPFDVFNNYVDGCVDFIVADLKNETTLNGCSFSRKHNLIKKVCERIYIKSLFVEQFKLGWVKLSQLQLNQGGRSQVRLSLSFPRQKNNTDLESVLFF